MSDARTELRERLVVVERAAEAAEVHVQNPCKGDYVIVTTVGVAIEATRDGIRRALDAVDGGNASPEA